MPVGSTTDRNYTDLLNGTSKTETSGTTFNAVFSDEDNSDLDVQDFFDLMVTQLTNQDFTNPVDDTQYMSQLAQFSAMKQMTVLAEYSQSNYAMSFLGKEVTAAKNKIGGSVEKTTGIVTSISLVDNEYTLTVDGKTFSLEQIMSVDSSADTGTAEGGGSTEA